MTEPAGGPSAAGAESGTSRGHDEEVPLSGGNLSDGVVRIGSTVRRPTGPWTPAVHALLRHLEAAGFDGAPRVLGVDEKGREVLEHIEGEVAWPEGHHHLLGTDDALAKVGRLLRRFHDAVGDFVSPAEAVWRFPEMQADALAHVDRRGLLVCHNDAAAWNLVVGGQRWVFIDWDVAGPRPPIWDVAYTAIGVVPLAAEAPHAGWPGPVPVARRLVALANGYGLDRLDRERLADVIVARVHSSTEHMRRRALAGISPWDAMWRGAHGATWRTMATYAEASSARWRRSLTR